MLRQVQIIGDVAGQVLGRVLALGQNIAHVLDADLIEFLGHELGCNISSARWQAQGASGSCAVDSSVIGSRPCVDPSHRPGMNWILFRSAYCLAHIVIAAGGGYVLVLSII